MIDRRAGMFTERISLFMARTSAAGAAFILLNPKFDITIFGQSIHIGGAGFSLDLQGSVITLVAGWTAVKEYWLGSSAGSEKKSDAIQKMAEGAPQVTAVAVEANRDVLKEVPPKQTVFHSQP